MHMMLIQYYISRNTRYYEKYTRFCVETVESDESSLSALGSLTLLSKVIKKLRVMLGLCSWRFFHAIIFIYHLCFISNTRCFMCGSMNTLGRLSSSTLKLAQPMQLGPQCVTEKILPLIFGIYDTVFTDTDNVVVDHTMVHIRRVLKLTLLSVYSV